MAKPLGVVAVIDLQSSATGLATDLERSGHEPSLTFVSSEEDVRRLSGDSCDLVVAFHPNPMLPPKRVLEVLSETTDAPPVVVYSRTFADDEIVALVQAGAHDCVRHGDNWREFPLMVEAGMSPMATLRSATVNAAALCGIEAEVGTLDPGKRADVIALAENPLQDISRMSEVVMVMSAGQIHPHH